MTENLLIPQRMLYQTPGDYRVTSKEEPGKRACKGKKACPRHDEDHDGGAEGSREEKKVIKRCRKCKGADFTFTQRQTDRLTERDRAHVV